MFTLNTGFFKDKFKPDIPYTGSGPAQRLQRASNMYINGSISKRQWTDARRPVPRPWIRSPEVRLEHRYENENSKRQGKSFFFRLYTIKQVNVCYCLSDFDNHASIISAS